MKIGIIGTGKMAKRLGKIWAYKGNDVFFGSREPQVAQKLAEKIGEKTTGGSYSEAVEFAEVLVLAIPWSAVKETIDNLGDLSGKIIIDCTNIIAPILGGSHEEKISGAEQIAEWMKGARVVKAFNTTGEQNIKNLIFGTQRATTFICGDNIDAKSKVKTLGLELGFDVIDAGNLKNSKFLECLARFWIELAYNQGYGEGIAFKLLHRRIMPE